MGTTESHEVKWEFGSLEWCQFAGELGVRLIEEANLDLGEYQWGFSEEYLHTPERLMAGRDRAGYYFMVHGGTLSGGAGLPDECLAIPGFHVSIEWALIAHPSAFIYGRDGQQKRSADAAVLDADLKEAGKGSEQSAWLNPSDPLFPSAIGAALGKDSEDGGGLHNLTAGRLRRSPELEGLPETARGVPIFTKMTDEQKARFIGLLGR